MAYKLVLKDAESYSELPFVFESWEDMVDFMEMALESNPHIKAVVEVKEEDAEEEAENEPIRN